MNTKTVQLLSIMVPETLDIKWEIKELYRQTSIEDTPQPAQQGIANPMFSRGRSGTQNLTPSTKEAISVSLKGRPSGTHKAKWYFCLNYHGSTGTEGEWKLSLQRKTKARDSVIVQLDMKILNTDGSEFWKQSAEPFRLYPEGTQPHQRTTNKAAISAAYGHQKPPQNQNQSEWSEMKVWSVANALDLHNVLVDGTLTIHIRLQQLEKKVYRTDCEPEAEMEVEDKVGNDIKSLLLSGDNADFEIRVTTNDTTQKIFKVHKCILTARSKYFKEILSEESEAIKNGLITFEDVHPDTVQILLTFIYSGSADLTFEGENSDKIIREVFAEAVKASILIFGHAWKLSELLEIIGNRIIDLCSPNNAMDLLKLAKEQNLVSAVQEIRNYIQKNIQEIL